MSYGGGEQQASSPSLVLFMVLVGVLLGGILLSLGLYTKARVPPPVAVPNPPLEVAPPPPPVVAPQPAQ